MGRTSSKDLFTFALMDLDRFREESKNKSSENKKYLGALKKSNPRRLDENFQRLHEDVFSETDCLECANCCKTTSPIFKDRDIDRLARHLSIKPGELIEKFLHLDDEGDYVLNSAPCPFLLNDNYCSVYEARPRACKEYPHTDRKKIKGLLNLTYKNTMVCPAVFEIVERLKKLKV